jgi:hypothetical protein
MPRDLPPASLQAVLAQETAEAFLVLLHIEGDNGLDQRLTSDSVETLTGGTGFEWTTPTTWNSASEDPDGVWATNGDNTFDADPTGLESRSNYVFSVFDAVSNLTDGQTYTCNFTISGLTGQGNIRIWLGDSSSVVQACPSNGDYSVDVVANLSANEFIRIEETCSDAATYLLTIVNFTQPPGETYLPFPFDITLPKNVDGQVSTATLSLSNINREFIDDIRSLTTPLRVNIKVVLGSNPDEIMAEFTDFVLRQVSYNTASISGTLTLEDFLNEPVGILMTGATFPGLFYE